MLIKQLMLTFPLTAPDGIDLTAKRLSRKWIIAQFLRRLIEKLSSIFSAAANPFDPEKLLSKKMKRMILLASLPS